MTATPFVQARRALRQVLTEAQKNLCALCGGRFSRAKRHRVATLEHIVAVRYGGKWRDCVAAHARCNGSKGHRIETDREREILAEVWAAVRADERLNAHAEAALAVLEAAPDWAVYGHSDGSPKNCDCSECLALDAAYPNEGRQMLLPIARQY
jgi:hypothetical protein